MDLDTILASGSAAETLKCFICENYLSYFPVISVCSNSRSICGRCVLPEGSTSHRDVAFETVVQFLRFPCRYKSEGCFEDLQPKDVPQHEENCQFRIVKCIVDEPERCEWSGSLPTLTDHCQKEHSDVFLKSAEFEMDLSRSAKSHHLMKVDDKLFIFWKSFDFESKIFKCAVYLNDYETDVESYDCQLSISSGKTTISHDFDTTRFEKKVFEAVGVLFVKKDIGNQDPVTIKICLRKTEIGNENGKLEDKAKDSKMRDLLKCSKCDSFAGPSIFRDAESMTVLCAACNSVSAEGRKESLQSNTTAINNFRFTPIFHPTASSTESSKKLLQSNNTGGSIFNSTPSSTPSFFGIPSFTETPKEVQQSNKIEDKVLSSFAALLTYPCKFQECGCTFTALLAEVQTHEKCCQYKHVTCMFKKDCQWKGFTKDVESHLLHEHSHDIIDLELLKETTISNNDLNSYFKVVKFCNRLFCLNYSVQKNGTLFCSVKKITIFCKQEFNFEIEVADMIGPNGSRHHLIRQRCGQLENLAHDEVSMNCSFPKEQVFGKSQEGKFKLRIFRTL